jgi:hypothetical protein
MKSQLPASRAAAKAAGLKHYFTGKPCKFGHLSARLVSCGQCSECNKQRLAAGRAKNPDKFRLYSAKAYQSNPQKFIDAAKRRRSANLSAALQAERATYARNKEKVNAAQRISYKAKASVFNEARRNRRLQDSVWAFSQRSRCLVRGALTRSGFKKSKRTEELLGCSTQEFRVQMERQFLPGMGWHNMHLWEIDHIVPASSARTQEEAEVLNRVGNLRPLWRDANRSKGAAIQCLL